MNTDERAVLETVMRNLEGYQKLPSPDQADLVIKMTMRCLSSLLKEDDRKRNSRD